MTRDEEINIIARIKNGERELYSTIVDEYSKRLLIFVSGFTKDGDVEIIAKNIKYIAEDDLKISAKNVNIESQSLKHNGKDIGHTHLHNGVTAGADNTGAPI